MSILIGAWYVLPAKPDKPLEFRRTPWRGYSAIRIAKMLPPTRKSFASALASPITIPFETVSLEWECYSDGEYEAIVYAEKGDTRVDDALGLLWAAVQFFWLLKHFFGFARARPGALDAVRIARGRCSRCHVIFDEAPSHYAYDAVHYATVGCGCYGGTIEWWNEREVPRWAMRWMR